jgi:hypothetical protein
VETECVDRRSTSSFGCVDGSRLSCEELDGESEVVVVCGVRFNSWGYIPVTGISVTTLLDGRGGSARKLREGEEVLEGHALE